MRQSIQTAMQKLRRPKKGARSSSGSNKLVMILGIAVVVLLAFGAFMFLRSRSTNDDKKTPVEMKRDDSWLILPKEDGTYRVVENNGKESFQIENILEHIGAGVDFPYGVAYVRNHLSILQQSMDGYDFFEEGECNESRCRTIDLSKNEDVVWFLNTFHEEVSRASLEKLEKVSGINVLFRIARIVNLDPLTIRIGGNEDGSDVVVGHRQGQLPLITAYQWLLYLRKHEGKPLPATHEGHNYAIGLAQ